MRFRNRFICVSIAWIAGHAVLAQDAPPPAAEKPDSLAAIQAMTSLTDEHRVKIRTFVSEHVNDVVSGTPEAAARVAELRSEYGKGSPAFKEAYAAICVETIAGAYKSAKLERAAQLLGVLTALNEAPAYRVFIEATSDPRPAIRTAGVAGLRGLRLKLAQAGAGYFSESVEALRAAGKKETSTVGLRTIYQALNFPEVVPSVPDAKLLTAAVMDILETRSEQYAARSVKGEGADHSGLALAASLKGSLSDADREKLIVISGRMMLHGVQRYITELIKVNDKSGNAALIDARNQTEYLIDECERMLLDILKPATPPNLTKAMRESDKEPGSRGFEMKKAMNAWADILKAKTGQKFDLEDPGDGG